MYKMKGSIIYKNRMNLLTRRSKRGGCIKFELQAALLKEYGVQLLTIRLLQMKSSRHSTDLNKRN